MKITDVYGYPTAICEPFSPTESQTVKEDIEHLVYVGKSVLKSESWNANCLTSSPNASGDRNTTNQNILDDKTFLIQTIETCFREYMKQIGLFDHIDPFMYKCGKPSCKDCARDCWINVYREGHAQETHWHHGQDTGCVFGFVYFCKYDHVRDGKFTFVNPAPDLKVPGMEACPAFRREFAPDVREGSLLFFPAFLLHYVTTQISGERITIAGNFYVSLK